MKKSASCEIVSAINKEHGEAFCKLLIDIGLNVPLKLLLGLESASRDVPLFLVTSSAFCSHLNWKWFEAEFYFFLLFTKQESHPQQDQ